MISFGEMYKTSVEVTELSSMELEEIRTLPLQSSNTMQINTGSSGVDAYCDTRHQAGVVKCFFSYIHYKSTTV